MSSPSLRLLLSSFVVAALMGGSSGCREWLDEGLNAADDALLVDFDVSLNLPGGIIVPYPGSAVLNSGVYPTDSESGLVKLPFLPTPAVPINMVDIDPTGKLGEYQDNIRTITIKRITATVTDNNFPAEIQPIAIHIGDFDDSVDNSLKAAETPLIAVGTNPVVEATIDPVNQASIGNVLKGLAFSVTTRTSVKKPDVEIPAGGSFTIKFKIDVTITATPIPQ